MLSEIKNYLTGKKSKINFQIIFISPLVLCACAPISNQNGFNGKDNTPKTNAFAILEKPPYYVNHDKIDLEKEARKIKYTDNDTKGILAPFGASVDLSPNGRLLINNSLNLYDTKTGLRIKSIPPELLSDKNYKFDEQFSSASIIKIKFLNEDTVAISRLESGSNIPHLFIFSLKANKVLKVINNVIRFDLPEKEGELFTLEYIRTEKRAKAPESADIVYKNNIIPYTIRAYSYRYAKYTIEKNTSSTIYSSEITNEPTSWPAMKVSRDGNKILEVRSLDGGRRNQLQEIDVATGVKTLISETTESMGSPKYVNGKPIVRSDLSYSNFLYPEYISFSEKWEVSTNHDRAIVRNSITGKYTVIKFPYCHKEINDISISRNNLYLTIGAIKDKDCFEEYARTSQPIWNIETGEELISKSGYATREKMKKDASNSSKSYREYTSNSTPSVAYRTGDFHLMTGPENKGSYSTWESSCKDGGYAFVHVEHKSPNIFSWGAGGFSGARGGADVGVGVEAAMRKACRGRQ